MGESKVVSFDWYVSENLKRSGQVLAFCEGYSTIRGKKRQYFFGKLISVGVKIIFLKLWQRRAILSVAKSRV